MTPSIPKKSPPRRDARASWRLRALKLLALWSLGTFRVSFSPRFAPDAPVPRSHARAIDPDFHLKCLVVIGAALGSKSIFCGRLPATLQEFLQSRFAVSLEQGASTLFQRFEKRGSQHLLCSR